MIRSKTTMPAAITRDASGAVALIRLYDGELTSTEIGQLPTTTGNTVPEPGSMLLVGLSLAALGLNRRRKQ